MELKRFSLLPLLSLLLFFASGVEAARAKGPLRIGLVFDGPSELNARFEDELAREITALLGDPSSAVIDAKSVLQGDWTLPTVRANLDRLFAEHSVGAVIGLGVVASNELVHRSSVSKPAFAPFVPEGGALRARGVKNLSVIYGLSGFQSDLHAFRRLIGEGKTVSFALDPLYWSAVPDLKAYVSRIAAAENLKIELVDSSAFPGKPEAVYLGPMPRLTAAETVMKIAEVNRVKAPSFSFWGREAIAQGAFAAMGSESEVGRSTRLAKRLASHLQRVLGGESPSSLPAEWAPDTRLLINLRTASEIGFHPDWDTLRDAEAVGEIQGKTARLSFESALRSAVEANLDVLVKSYEADAQSEGVGIARSYLLPSLEASAGARIIDPDRARYTFGLNPERQVSAELTLTQTIFDEKVWSALSIQGDQRKIARLQKERVKLDIGFETAKAYLGCLKADRLVTIQQSYLASSRTNLQIARDRRVSGSATLIDVYRWESEAARSERQVNDAQAQRRIAGIVLGRLLHRRLSDAVQLEDLSYEDPRLLYRDDRARSYFANPWDYRLFSDFMVQESLASLPEVQAMDSAVSAQERQVTSVKREKWLPKLALQGQLQQQLYAGGLGSGPTTITLPNLPPFTFPSANDTRWSIGVQARLPIFEGFRTSVESDRESAKLLQVKSDRDRVREKAEEQVRSVLEQLRSAKAAIELSKRSSDSARKSFDLVRGAYAKGAVQMTALVESQNAAVAADQAAAVAGYDFLVDLMALQRAVAHFDLLMSPNEKKSTLDRLKAYFEMRRKNPDVSIQK